MAKKKHRKRHSDTIAKKYRLVGCENRGGLWIDPCQSLGIATETLRFRPRFDFWPTDTIRLCLRCALQVKEQAELAGYEVTME
jgi:hypothetical protein